MMKLQPTMKLKGWIKSIRKEKKRVEVADEDSAVEESDGHDGSVVKEDDMETQDPSEENPDETTSPDVKNRLKMKSLVRALAVARKTQIPEEDTLDQSESTVSTMLVDKVPHQHGQSGREMTKRQKQRLFMDNLFELSREHIANTPKQRVVPGTRAHTRSSKKYKAGSVKTRKKPIADAAFVKMQQTGQSSKFCPMDFLAEVSRCSEVKCGPSDVDDVPEKVLLKHGGNSVEEDVLKTPFHCGPRNTDDNIDDAEIAQDRGPFRLDRVNGLVKEEIPLQVNAADDEVEITKGKVKSPLDVVKKVVQCGSVQDEEEVDLMELVRSDTEVSPSTNIQYRDPKTELRDTVVDIGGRGGMQEKYLVKKAVPQKQIRVVTTENLQNDFNDEVVDLVHLILDKEKGTKRDDASTITTRKSLLATGLNPR